VASDVWMTGWMMNLKGLETFKGTVSICAEVLRKIPVRVACVRAEIPTLTLRTRNSAPTSLHEIEP